MSVPAHRSFQQVLAELDQVHDHEQARLREVYDQRLSEMHQVNEVLRGRLSTAETLIAALDPSISLDKMELAAELDKLCGEAGIGAEDRAGTSCDSAPDEDPAVLGIGPSTARRRRARPGAAKHKEAAPPHGVGTKDGSHDRTRWLWEVIGGEDRGGIVVREGESMNSTQFVARLSTGALVEEIELFGDRLHFKRLTGAGPKQGWISTRTQEKVLAIRADRPPLRPRQLPPDATGPNNEVPLPLVLVFREVALPKGILATHKEMPVVKEMLDNAKSAITLENIMFNFETVSTLQILLCQFMSGLAALERLRGQRPEAVSRAWAMAGTGYGQYVALCAAGALSFKDGVELVKVRAIAQDECYKTSLSQLRTISVGLLDRENLEPLCHRACKLEGAGALCQISAYMAKRSFWVAGTAKAVEHVGDLARKGGAQVMRLFSGAPHTVYARPAQAKLSQALDKVAANVKSPLHSVWMLATGEPVRPGCNPADIIADLKIELTSPMLVSHCFDAMRREGIREIQDVQLTTDLFVPVKPKAALDWADPLGVQGGHIQN